MKKLALTTVCAFAVTSGAFAQGFANWVSSGMTAASITAATNTAVGTWFGGPGTGGVSGAANTGTAYNGSAATGFYYELLYSSYTGSQATITSLSSLLTWQDAGLQATNQLTAGRLNPTVPNTAATVPWAAGTTDSIVLVGWSANLGSTWGVVSNLLATQGANGSYAAGSFFGVSATGYMAAGSANPGTTLFATGANSFGLPINSLNTQLYALPTSVVPEPTTLALAGLGGLSLLLFRRRQQK
jgi:hypothetical protein